MTNPTPLSHTDFRALCADLLDEVVARPLLLDRELIARARTALAEEPAVPQPQPQPPADGEVAGLVAWLQETGDTIQPSHLAEHQRYKRAAKLLERQALVPVAVSERLPGPEDCDGEGRCWWLALHQSWPCLYLMKADIALAAAVATHWLPAHALPIPHQQETTNG